MMELLLWICGFGEKYYCLFVIKTIKTNWNILDWNRYGDCHPVFFIGSLEAAFQEAFYGKARDVSTF